MAIIPQEEHQFDTDRPVITFRRIDGSYGVKLQDLVGKKPRNIAEGDMEVLDKDVEKYSPFIDVCSLLLPRFEF